MKEQIIKNKIALVTGANKGIGFEIAKELVEKGWTVILTARNQERGTLAVDALKRQACEVDFQRLDVCDPKSISVLKDYLGWKYGRLDVLVNNAGIFLDDDMSSLDVDLDTVKKTFDTNLFGPLRVSQALVPLLKKSDDARIINLSSGLGQLHDADSGYPSYSMSKAALNMLTVKMAADLNNTRIKVNTVCPGWVRTDMGGSNATRSVQEGADTPVWLATAQKIPSGKFLRNRKEIAW